MLMRKFSLFAIAYLLDMMKITKEITYENDVKRVEVVVMGTEQNRRKIKMLNLKKKIVIH